MTNQPDPDQSKEGQNDRNGDSGLSASLQKLTTGDAQSEMRFGARLRNYFLTGLLVVGPVTITIYIIWWLINVADAWLKPLVPVTYLPETYLPFAVPGISLLFGVGALTIIGALTANLLGRTLVSYGEQMLGRMPIVRNVYNALKQIFESAVTATGSTPSFQKVGLIEFPSKGLWSVVFVTGETAGEIQAVKPGGESDLLTVFMPTGIVPPQGFICFVPRKDVILLKMTSEDAAKIIISAGMVTPDYQRRLNELAAKARADELVDVAGKALAGSPKPSQATDDGTTTPANTTPGGQGNRKRRKAVRRETRTK
ncbi:MAG: DUF502 domain-containing protein [Hyphomicrobiaceae bacterium]